MLLGKKTHRKRVLKSFTSQNRNSRGWTRRGKRGKQGQKNEKTGSPKGKRRAGRSSAEFFWKRKNDLEEQRRKCGNHAHGRTA